MNKVYTGIDIGSDTVKVVVCEVEDGTFHCLASISEKSKGIKRGRIVDTKLATVCIRKAVKKASDMVGVKITKAIVCIPGDVCQMDIVVGNIDLPSGTIDGEDVIAVLKDAIVGRVPENQELITAIPINFIVDGENTVKDPKGMEATNLEAKVVIATTEKKFLYQYLETLKLSGIEAVDVAFSATGDYYEVKNEKIDAKVGAIINIGEDSTDISVFNKGIMIKSSRINVGSRNVDHDISYIYKVNMDNAKDLKENFSVASANYADSNDIEEIMTKKGEKKYIDQVGISRIVEARLKEILNLAKNELKNLTNREIRYIIITGGVSELAGFQYLIEDVFPSIGKVCNITTMGTRHNKFSSALGVTKYLDEKLALRGKEISMFTGSDIESMVTIRKKDNNDTIVSKVFGHFFDN